MGHMAMNKLTPEQVWTWIDEGRADAELRRLQREPLTAAADLAMVEDLMALDRHLTSSLLEEPSAGFDKAVLSVHPDWMPRVVPAPPLLPPGIQKLLLGLLAFALGGGVLLSLIGLLSGNAGSEIPNTSPLLTQLTEPGSRWLDSLAFHLPNFSEAWLVATALALPVLLLFWALDRGLNVLLHRR